MVARAWCDSVTYVFPLPGYVGREGIARVAPTDGEPGPGPPFCLTPELVKDLLAPHGFEMLHIGVPTEATPRREGSETVAYWQRPAAASTAAAATETAAATGGGAGSGAGDA